MNRVPARLLTLVLPAIVWIGCGSSTSGTDPDASPGPVEKNDAPPSTGPSAYGLFEVHYIPASTGASANSAYTEVSGVLYDGEPTALVIWDKKTAEGPCALYVPRTPFCEACASGQVCVDTNVCKTPPAVHEVGDVTVTGLTSPSGANPILLANVKGAYGSAETLPNPACTEGSAITMAATGAGSYPAFQLQARCIAPLEITNNGVLLESGKSVTLTWTPPGASSGSTINVVFDLSHHGGSKGKVICDTADTGSLTVSANMLSKLMDLGVTGYPYVIVTRLQRGTAEVGNGQAQLKVYSDITIVADVPGIVSCQSDADCPDGETCTTPGQLCGIACTTQADCPTGRTCHAATKMCR